MAMTAATSDQRHRGQTCPPSPGLAYRPAPAPTARPLTADEPPAVKISGRSENTHTGMRTVPFVLGITQQQKSGD